MEKTHRTGRWKVAHLVHPPASKRIFLRILMTPVTNQSVQQSCAASLGGRSQASSVLLWGSFLVSELFLSLLLMSFCFSTTIFF